MSEICPIGVSYQKNSQLIFISLLYFSRKK
jgi:hypothetical protein